MYLATMGLGSSVEFREDSANSPSDLMRTIWFHDNMVYSHLPGFAFDHIACISGCQNNGNAGVDLQECLRRFDSVHFRHVQIGDHEVEIVRIF